MKTTLLTILGLLISLHGITQNHPPTFTTTPVTTVNENETYIYSINTSDVDGDAVTVTAPTLPFWLTFKTNKTVTPFAGSTKGFADGTGTASQFSTPSGVAVDVSGNVYVADIDNNKIRKITPAGVVTTLAGSTTGFADGTGSAAKFAAPSGVTVDASGNVYVADSGNNKIRKITPAGVVTTLAGSNAGYWDATGTAAQFNDPVDIDVDSSGNLYVADFSNNKIRKITPAGVVTTLAGSTNGFADGTGSAAQFNYPIGVAVDNSGNVYVGDKFNNKIRKITPAGVVTTFAGGSYASFANGTGTNALFSNPSGIDVDASGNVYVADYGNNMIRKITPAGVVTSFVGPDLGFAENGSAFNSQFNNPTDVVVDASGIFYVADEGNNKIRKITQVVLSGNAAGHVGIHHVVLNANDGNGSSTDQSFTITVNDITPPTITTLSPLDNATGITSSNLQITFSENVQQGAGNILIKKASDNSVVATIDVTSTEVSISNAVVSLNLSPILTFPSNTSLYVQIPNTCFKDMSGNAFAGITDTTTWNFDTATVLAIDKNIIKGFAMYPNPVKGVLNISTQEIIRQIKIYNLLGAQVAVKNINTDKIAINLSYLPQGVYFAKVTTDKTIKSIEFIKQ